MDSIAPVSLVTHSNSASNIKPPKTDPSSSQAFGTLLNHELENSKEARVIAEYTSVITTQFVGAIFEEQSELFDSGDGASDHYHSMLVDAVSEQLTKTDALGLKSIIQWEVSKW